MDSQNANGVLVVIQPGPFVVQYRFAGAAFHPINKRPQARRLGRFECARLLHDEPRSPEAIPIAGIEHANDDLLCLRHEPVDKGRD